MLPSNQAGQAIVEYELITAFIAVIIISLFCSFNNKVEQVKKNMECSFKGAAYVQTPESNIGYCDGGIDSLFN